LPYGFAHNEHPMNDAGGPTPPATESRNSIEDIWGPRTPFDGEGRWPERIDSRTIGDAEQWVQSACVLCSNGCALDIGVAGNRIVGVRGRGADHVNRGRLGPKGLHGWEANHSSDRLSLPLIRKEGALQPASWDEAMSLIVSKSKELRETFTASAIGFYTSGQLFLEEYYTLALIGKGGLGTPHMDGNTRLCTATAGEALKQSFGSDGQPGTYFDIDQTDCLFLVGHNMAATDTVLWSRVLDRRRGARPPKLIVVDPRTTMTAREADIHLTPRVGTNVALLNGLLNLLIASSHIDRTFIEKHTVGFDKLRETVEQYPPERVAEITGVPELQLREAAAQLGSAPTLLSTCLQGVYQSMQATAAAVQVNNINLIRGMIGKPGCGILQMNGQPTAQNTRETGADGDLPGFRNWDNPKHIEELARIWNVETAIIPHWAPPTHALEIFHLAETGSLRMLWISGTNPAVSLPNLSRVRDILQKSDLFVVVQDAFLTETGSLADVVLPAALWGEKSGTFTNVDRTVHISHKAIDPPGDARSDFDIFLDYARRMDFRDKDGAPLVKWTTVEEAFEAWRACTRGRPCDYSGLSYEKLSAGSGIQWPCTDEQPAGTRRLYADHRFPTDPDICESYGHDLITGAAVTPEQYRANNPGGRAQLKAAEYHPPHEIPDEKYPFMLTTGRLVYHFHTRTKTARSQALNDAAPDAYVEMCKADAERLGIKAGQPVRLTSRRGKAEAPVRIAEVLPGHLFMPFHYGYWDKPERARAANELTIYEWDPISKQPHFKYAAVQVRKVRKSATAQPEKMDARSQGVVREVAGAVGSMIEGAAHAITGPPRSHVQDYLGLLHLSEQGLVRAFEQVRSNHPDAPDIHGECTLFAAWSKEAAEALEPFKKRYGERSEGEPKRLEKALIRKRSSSGFTLVRDLHDLWLLVNESVVSITILLQAAQALRDREFERVLSGIKEKNARQRSWLMTRLKQAAPQALVVPI
jgi:ferredoxin-nitrate reductase